MKEENEKISDQAEEIKKETIETAKVFKDSVKNVNIKDETKNAKNFIIKMFREPLGTIQEIANDETNKFLKTALFILVIWILAVFLKSTYATIYYWGFDRVWNNILSVLKAVLAPGIGIIVYSVIVLILNKENKKSLITNITTLTISQLPSMIASIVLLLNLFSKKIIHITSYFSNLCSILTVVLTYFALKALFAKESNKEFFKKYVIIQLIFFVCAIIISFFEINIY